VLRPGGRLLIADIFATRQYGDRLRALGLGGIRQERLGWRMWWSGPWVPTTVVIATKPAAFDGQGSESDADNRQHTTLSDVFTR
jgi:arsenite methyltransferase